MANPRLPKRTDPSVPVAVELGVADCVGDGERGGEQIAATLDLDRAAAIRLLRALAAVGLIDEPSEGRFALTGAGHALRSDRPDSLRDFVAMFGDPVMLAAWRHLPHAMRTAATTFNGIHGVSFFDYLAQRPALSAPGSTPPCGRARR